MAFYRVTKRGEELAQASGLASDFGNQRAIAELANKINPKLSILDLRYSFSSAIRSEAVETTRRRIAEDEESNNLLTNGLGINHASNYWRYPKSEQTYEPSEGLWLPPGPLDPLVVSGALGSFVVDCLELEPDILERYLEYGFSNQLSAAGFIGAFFVDKYLSQERVPGPSFEIPEIDMVRSFLVSEDGNEDLILISKRGLVNGPVISPIDTEVEFAPMEEVEVFGYHSMMPVIVASLIADQYKNEGNDSARQLIIQMQEVIKEILEDNLHEQHSSDLSKYDLRNILSELVAMLKCESSKPTENRKYLSDNRGPDSNYLFQIIENPVGVRFKNLTEVDGTPSATIDVPRENYVDLFRIIVLKSQARTTIYELKDTLNEALSMLNANS